MGALGPAASHFRTSIISSLFELQLGEAPPKYNGQRITQSDSTFNGQFFRTIMTTVGAERQARSIGSPGSQRNSECTVGIKKTSGADNICGVSWSYPFHVLAL